MQSSRHATRACRAVSKLPTRPLVTCRYSTNTGANTPKQSRAISPFILIGLVAGSTYYYYSSSSSSFPSSLNTETFSPYTITSRDPISPTSFIISAVANNPSSTETYLSNSSWRFPLWSVEFKQPEVQIARHYTPLPGTSASGELRFYVRAIGGGEMSSYLNRLHKGSEVFLRGPHPGFEVGTRLGAQDQVVFLAGGTGVVPGLQVAKAVLDDKDDARFTLLWAVRKREEVQCQRTQVSWWQSLWGVGPREVEVIEQPSPIGREIQQLKTQYGDRFRIHVAVDEEKTAFTAREVQSSINTTTHTEENRACQLHSQKQHALLSEFEEERKPCVCDPSITRGKNLFFVSGPEGFVSHFAGPKTWINGVEAQGPVGGVLARVQQSNSSFKSDWLILKL